PTASAVVDVPSPFAWEPRDPKELGFDRDALREADRAASRRVEILAVVVLRRGHLVWERYYGGHERDIVWDDPSAPGTMQIGDWYPVAGGPEDAQNVKCITKSVLSLLVGIALESGGHRGVDDPISLYLPEYFRAERDE